MNKKEQRKANRLAKREARRAKREARKAKRQARRAAFFQYKFLRVRKFFMVEKHRANLKFAVNMVWTSLALVLGAVAAVLVEGALIDKVIAGMAVAGFVIAVQLVIPTLIAQIKAKRKARFTLRAQAADADAWYHAVKAEKLVAREAKAHAKASNKKNKAINKNQKLVEAENKRKAAKAAKEQSRKEIDSDFKVEVKEKEVPTMNVKLK